MKKGVLAVAVATAAICGLPSLARANPAPSIAVVLPVQGKKAKPTKFVVVKVDSALQVAAADKVKELTQAADAKYKRDLRAWTESKKLAAKSKQKFSEPKPKKSRPKVVSPSFKTEAEAQAHVAKMTEKASGKRSAKTKRSKKGDKKDDDKKGDKKGEEQGDDPDEEAKGKKRSKSKSKG